VRRPRLRTDVDWYLLIGDQKRPWPSPWFHVAYFIGLVAFVIAAVLLAGGRFDLS
jgi:hypothetical protein